MNHQFYRIVYQYPFWCKLSDTVFEANYVFEGILLPISYIICIWIDSYRFGWHPYAPPQGFSSVQELSLSNKTMVCAYILTFEKCRDFF